MKTTKNCCPCCGSKNITIDVDITVSACFENGRLIFNGDRNAIDDAIEVTDYDQMCGFCYDCDDYFSIDHIDDDGVYFSTDN